MLVAIDFRLEAELTKESEDLGNEDSNLLLLPRCLVLHARF